MKSTTRRKPRKPAGKTRGKRGGRQITGRQGGEDALRRLNVELERRVAEQTSELRRTHQAAQAERQRLYSVLETLPAYVVLLSADYHVPFANRFFRERFGDSGGKRCFEYLFGRSEPCENCESYKAMETRKPHRWEWSGPDGRHYDVYDFPFTDADGSLMVLEMGSDITDRKKAETALKESYETLERRVAERTAALRESEEKYRQLFQNMSEGFALYELIEDEDGRPVDWRILEVNDAYSRHTGIARERIVGRRISEVFPEVAKEYLPRFAKVVGTRTPADFETYSQVAGRYLHVVNFPVSGRRFAGIIEDITERKRTEEALRQSREDLGRAQEVGQIGWWRLDTRRNVLTWSDENYRIFGVAPGTPLTYETFLEMVHPEDRPFVDARWKAGLRGEPYDLEHRIVAGGEVKWVREKAYLEFDPAGALQGGFGITQDITERKEAEEALRKSEARYRSYLDVTDQLGWTTDADGLVVDDLPAWRRYTGQSLEEIRGWGWSKAVHPDDLEQTSEVWRKAVQEKRNYEVEYRLRRHDGVYRHFLARGVPSFNEDGTIREWVGTCIDITERKEAEQVLRRSRDELEELVKARSADLLKEFEERKKAEEAVRRAAAYNRSLIEASLDPLVTIGPEGKITDVNAASEAATGRTRAELIGTDFSDYFTEPEKARAGYQQVFREGLVRDYPLEIRRRDGKVTPVLYNASVYHDEAGNVIGVFAAARDITERRRMEAEKERYQRRLRELAERLAATEERERHRISAQIHDTVIQTLSLSSIKLGGLCKGMADAGWKKEVGEAKAVRGMIEEAIAESRSLMGELTPPLLYELGLVPALQDLTERLQKLHGRPIRLVDDGQPKPVDKAIQGLLFQATRELITNALKHAGSCAVTVEVSQQGGELQIRVEDDGTGFEVPEDRRFVFHRGGGFGLFMIAERLAGVGGRVELQSRPGQGTRAHLLVPLGSA